MAQEDTLRKHVVSELRACVISVKDGIPLSQINEEYASLVGVPIPLSQLGYCSIEAFFNSAAEFHLEPCRNQPGEFTVWAAQNNSSSHIQALVAKQKPAKKKPAYRKPMARGYSFGGRGNIGYVPKWNLQQLKNEREPVPNLPHRAARHSLNNRNKSDGEQRNHIVSRPLTQIQQNNRNGPDATFKRGHQDIKNYIYNLYLETRLSPQKKLTTKGNYGDWGAVHERDNLRLQVEDVSEEEWVSGTDWDMQPEPCYQMDDDENWMRNVRHSNVFGLQITVVNLDVIRGNYRDTTSHFQRMSH